MAEKYVKLAKLGEGSFGVVWKVRHRETGQVFARKKIRMQARDNGVSLAAIDEINALQVRLWCCVLGAPGTRPQCPRRARMRMLAIPGASTARPSRTCVQRHASAHSRTRAPAHAAPTARHLRACTRSLPLRCKQQHLRAPPRRVHETQRRRLAVVDALTRARAHAGDVCAAAQARGDVA